MASADNMGYVKRALALTVAPSAVLAESKFLSLDIDKLIALLGFSVAYRLFGIVDMALDRLLDTGRLSVEEQLAIQSEIVDLS